MKRLYLDESGSHNLARHDPDYPIFVFGGVIIEDAAEAEIRRLVDDFKRAVIGRDTKADYDVVRAKMRRGPTGRVDGAGLVVLPTRRGRGPLRSSRPRDIV